VTFILLVSTLLILVGVYNKLVKSTLESLLGWVQGHPYGGPFLISFTTMCVVILLLPYSIMAMSTGYTMSQCFSNTAAAISIGTASIFVGAWCGSVIAYLVGRYLCRDQVVKLTLKYQVFSALDKTLESQGMKLVFLMRLSLLVPFNVSNYVFGGSAVRFTDYLLGTIGVLPIALFFVYMGTTMSNIQDALSGKEKMTTV
jgi:uncharacterized membrane protein YdjX (TVP38/TMEM64 family)